MTEERERMYRNAEWLLTQIDAEIEAGRPDISRIAAAADAAAFIVAELKRHELAQKKRPESWERALQRHHLSVVRGS